MWVTIRVDNREIDMVETGDNIEEVKETIYDELLEVYDGNEDDLIDDIENGDAEYCDSDMFAWSNRNGHHDIKAFWV